MRIVATNILFFMLAFNFSCSKQGDFISDVKDSASIDVTPENVSYKNFVEPLLTKNCSTCHGLGGSAEVWWLNNKTYENAAKYSDIISTTIINKTMPPPPKFPFTNRDRNLMKLWIERGMPFN